MKDYMIRTNSYWCSFTVAETKGDSTVGVIAKFDDGTGVMTVLTTLDEHGVGLVVELADKLAKAEKRKAHVEAMLARLYSECDTGERRGNGSQSGVALPSWCTVEAARLLLGAK